MKLKAIPLLLLLATLMLLAGACGGGGQPADTPTQLPIATQTPYATYTPYPTYTSVLPTATQVPPTATTTVKPTAIATAEFTPGIYYRQPFLNSYGALLISLESIPLPSIHVEAFDIRPDAIVYAVDDKLVLVSPNANTNTIIIPGIHQMDRPSFSPDGSKVVVQGRETYTEPKNINIYICRI